MCALALALALSGCSSEGGDLSELLKASELYWRGGSDHVSLKDAASIPFATLGVRIDDGPEQILVLATDNGGVRLWTSSAHVSIAMRNGRIVRTSGFGSDLSGHLPRSTDREDWLKAHVYAWAADFRDIGYYSVAVTCQVTPHGRDPIEILGKSFDTVRVVEDCKGSDLDWNFENTYWVSEKTGRVWRSIQQFHPDGPEVEVEYLRPPEGDD